MSAFTHSHHIDQKSNRSHTQANPPSSSSKQHGHSMAYSQVPMISNRAVGLQAKTKISQPSDHYEQEADRVSRQIMQMSAPQAQQSCSCGGTCPKCQAEQQSSPSLPQSHMRVQGMPDAVNQVLRSSGQPLDSASKTYFEPRFGQNFSDIRVHSGAAATRAAHSVGAEAFTVGNNIVLENSRSASRELIAHELTHTVQQGATTPLSGGAAHSEGVQAGGVSNTLQRRTFGIAGACWFENCDSQLNNFFMIHEDGLPGFHPSGTGSFRVDDVDGLWFKYHTPKTEWFKIPDIGTGQVTCNEDERNPTITSPVLPFATAHWSSDPIHTANPY